MATGLSQKNEAIISQAERYFQGYSDLAFNRLHLFLAMTQKGFEYFEIPDHASEIPQKYLRTISASKRPTRSDQIIYPTQLVTGEQRDITTLGQHDFANLSSTSHEYIIQVAHLVLIAGPVVAQFTKDGQSPLEILMLIGPNPHDMRET